LPPSYTGYTILPKGVSINSIKLIDSITKGFKGLVKKITVLIITIKGIKTN